MTTPRTSTSRLGGRQPRFLAFAILAAAVAAGGCATTYQARVSTTPAVTPPATWQAAAQLTSTAPAGDLSRWWQQLGDPTLTALVNDALASNPDIRIAQARLQQARAQRSLAAAQRLPSVALSASDAVADRNDGDATNSASLGIDASWEPDIFGRQRNAVDAADADATATALDLRAVHVSLSAEVALNYTSLRSAQARLDIARRNEASQAETRQLTEWRRDAGLATSLDVERARANHEQTRAQVASLGASIAQAMHRLSTLTGREPGALTSRLSIAAPLPTVPEQVAIGIPADTLRQRPDVGAAEQRLLAETLRVTQANASRYPSFTLRGSLGTDIVSGIASGGTSLVGSLVGGLAHTLVDGGRIRQQIEIQGAVQAQALASYESAILTALEDVENALVSLDATRQRLGALDAAADAARNAALLARQQYTSGLTDFQTVLDTERTVLSVEDSVASTESDRIAALVQLYKALGGGWSTTSAPASQVNPS